MRQLYFVSFLVLLALSLLSISGPSSRAEPPASTPNASTIQIATSPADLLIEVNGTPAMAPHSFSCDPGENRTVNAPSPQVNGSTRYTFLNWSDGGSQFHTIDCAASGNYTAFFSREYALTIDTDPNRLTIEVDGSAYLSPVGLWCRSGEDHNVNAPSPQGFNATQFVFRNWSDGGGQAHTVPCDSPRSLVAFFGTTFTISIFSSRQGAFVIQVDGDLQLLPHTFTCDLGTRRILTVPSPQTVSGVQWRFSTWSDLDPTPGPNPRTVACDGSRNYTANFEPVDGTGPTQPPSQPIVAFVILAIVVLAVVLLGVLIWWMNRGKSPMVPPAGTPQGGIPAPVATRCPNCGSPREQDWVFCMTCGAPVR